MDLRVIDTQIQPLLSRITPDKPIPDTGSAGVSPAPVDDLGRFLSYTPEEQLAITKALDALEITYKVLPEDQPNPTTLANCQGRVATRSQALAAIAAGKPPTTIADLDTRITDAEHRLDAASLGR